MFERLFQKASTVKRYLAAPLLEARLRYLEHCAKRDLAQQTLQQIARNQVELVRILPLEPAGRLRLAQVEEAGERWNAERGGQPGRKRQRAFVGCATGWPRSPSPLRPSWRRSLPASGSAACPRNRSAITARARASSCACTAARPGRWRRSRSRISIAPWPGRLRRAWPARRWWPMPTPCARSYGTQKAGATAGRAWPR